jgi:hypothetical protein
MAKTPKRASNAMGLDRKSLSMAKTKTMMAGTSGERGSYMGSSAYNKLRKERDQINKQQDTIAKDTKGLVRGQVEQKVKSDIAKIDARIKAKRKVK